MGGTKVSEAWRIIKNIQKEYKQSGLVDKYEKVERIL